MEPKGMFSLFKTWKVNHNGHTIRSSKPVFKEVQCRDSLPNNCFESDFNIHFNRGKFYLQVSRTINPTEYKNSGEVKERDSVCAIDPGVRKFATVYSPEGKIEFLGVNTNKVLDKCIRRIEKRKKRLSKLKFTKPKHRSDKRRWRAKIQKHVQARLDAETKASEVAKNLHYNVAHHLCSNYKEVIYPDINLKDALSKTKNLNTKVKLRISHLRFGKFKSRLSETASYYGTKIITGSEAFTSKQCGKCGKLNEQLGKSEVWTCPSCKCSADRDSHAARNILLRFLAAPSA